MKWNAFYKGVTCFVSLSLMRVSRYFTKGCHVTMLEETAPLKCTSSRGIEDQTMDGMWQKRSKVQHHCWCGENLRLFVLYFEIQTYTLLTWNTWPLQITSIQHKCKMTNIKIYYVIPCYFWKNLSWLIYQYMVIWIWNCI